MLNWGEAQLKGIHIKPSFFNAKDNVTNNIQALGRQAREKSITIKDNIPPEITAYGDANHFDFIIRNLISNAIKFSHQSGTVEIGAKNNTASNEVIFSVKDYGKGISIEQQEHFIKGELDIPFGTSGEKGTGIGLMLSKEFIKANHGRIWLESAEGIGTIFYFAFPNKKSN